MEAIINNIKYKFFWKNRLSNWSIMYFIIDGIQYNCGEQYMMYQKALLFNDTEIAQQILECKNPKTQKYLGRCVRNFNSDIWDQQKMKIIKHGLKERFLQNPKEKKLLLSFNDCIFVEASPYDRIWGIGYDEKNAVSNFNNWGENLLGKLLTEIAKEIK